MPFVTADRVKETTTGTGNGTLVLAGAVPGFRSFSSVTADGDTVYYVITHAAVGDWEVGYGTRGSGPTIIRDAVIASSNADAHVDFAAGTKEVFLTLPAALMNQQLSGMHYVDSDKVIPTGVTRDGSRTFPFANMQDALSAWNVTQSGTIFVVSLDTPSFIVPIGGGGNYLRIVGLNDYSASGGGRTYLGSPDAIELSGNSLNLVLENVEINDIGVISGSGGASFNLVTHNCRLNDLDTNDAQVTTSESYFFDTDFYQSTFNLGANMGAPHFHNCKMGSVTFNANGSKIYVVSPQNRNTNHGVPQPFTLAWPSANAANRAYLDGVANYLRTGGDLTLTNGNAVVMA